MRSTRMTNRLALTRPAAMAVGEIHADCGRACIAPEKRLLPIDHDVWDPSVFHKNRDRPLKHAVIEGFFAQAMRLADQRRLLSKDYFTADAAARVVRAAGRFAFSTAMFTG